MTGPKHTPSAPMAVTMGEPAGIGGEIVLKSWLKQDSDALPYFVIDDPNRLETIKSELKLSVPIEPIQSVHEAKSIFKKALPVFPLSLKVPAIPGKPDIKNAPVVQRAIEVAVELTRNGEASAVVTNPIHKECLYNAGFEYPGHTEFLAELGGIKTPPVMMLACSSLRVVPITVHQSLQTAVSTLSHNSIVEKSIITHNALQRDFALAAPRLAIAGLNPHAGENGTMGREEIDIIIPAIAKLREHGIDVMGPLPSDTMFSEQMRQEYDAAICMYHDQALIPIKTLDFDHAVNVTLGLPFVRTSPDHGTALDIAGQGIASESSLMAALAMASEMVAHRNAERSGQKTSAKKTGLISA